MAKALYSPMRLFPTLAGALAVYAIAPAAADAQLDEERRIDIAAQLQRSTVVVHRGHQGGSGFVASTEGWVITNFHVIQGFQRYPITITYPNQQALPARVLAYDEAHDLALLEPNRPIEATPLPLADPSTIRVGQTVLAYGSPFGLDGTLTQGIVSARRDVPRGNGDPVEGLIQTDAPINPGNSGGPLVNSRGEVIGVNTMIISRTGGSNGIGFAMPANYVQELIDRVREARRVASAQPAPGRPEQPAEPAPAVWLGIAGDEFRGAGLEGVRVREVFPRGPAAAAGLRGARDAPPSFVRRLRIPWTGHIIVAVDGQPVRTMEDLRAAISRHRPGERAHLSLAIGSDAVRQEALVVLEAAPERPPASPSP